MKNFSPRKIYYDLFISTIKSNYAEITGIKNKEYLELIEKKLLNKLLIYCFNNVPYYRKLFRSKGVKSAEEMNLLRLDELPILTKKDIRNNFTQLTSQDLQKRKWYYNTSGGSTGEPIRLIQDSDYSKWNQATNTYYHEKILGIKRFISKEVRLWGNERDIFQGGYGIKKQLQNHFTNTVLLNSFKMNGSDIERYITIINSLKPDYIRGYAGSLVELSAYSQSHNIPLHIPKIVASAAETVTPDMRKIIEKGFKTKLYDFYGSREAMNLAGECSHGSMHIFSFNNIIEVVDVNNQPVAEGEEGRILVTPLHNYSMPLLRYEIGDTGIKGPDVCSCGNFLPTLKAVTGRVTDHFKLKDGSIVPAEYFIHLLGVVCKEDQIRKFQVIQEDYNKVRIDVVIHDELSTNYTQIINEKIRLVMEDQCEITWNIVDDIPKTQSGKYRYTISEVL